MKQLGKRAFLRFIPAFFAVCCSAAQAAQTPAPPMTVAIASGIAGSESVQVSGTAPAYSLVTIDTTALISEDLPTLSLGQKSVNADASGRFSVMVSLAPAYQRGVRVTATVAADGGRLTASASTFVAAPNAGRFSPYWDVEQGSR
jgi:multidrug efflux pump subunit AcrA (membrane-fusion protein)